MFLDKNDLNNSFHIVTLPQKKSTQKGYYRDLIKDLTPIEAIIYCTYNIVPVRKTATLLKVHYASIKRIYQRAYEKVELAKRAEKATNPHIDEGSKNVSYADN